MLISPLTFHCHAVFQWYTLSNGNMHAVFSGLCSCMCVCVCVKVDSFSRTCAYLCTKDRVWHESLVLIKSESSRVESNRMSAVWCLSNIQVNHSTNSIHTSEHKNNDRSTTLQPGSYACYTVLKANFSKNNCVTINGVFSKLKYENEDVFLNFQN